MAHLPKLSITNTGDGRITIMIPCRYSDDGRRKRMSFPSMEAAEVWREAFLKNVLKTGEKATVLSIADQEDAIAAILHLRNNGFNSSLKEAASFYIKAHSRFNLDEKFSSVFEEYRQHMIQAGYSSSTLNRLDILSRCLMPWYNQKNIGSLETKPLRDILNAASSTPAEFNNKLKTLKAFLNYAVKYEYLEKSPAEPIEKKKTKESIISIVTPLEARLLLSAQPEWQHVVAILLFAGIRVEELKRMSWSDIEEDEHKIIRVTGRNSKTGATRLIDIQPNLQQFLAKVPKPEKEGKIMKKFWEKPWKKMRLHAGIQNEKNQCRHSFASYLLASTNDINYVRSQLGHDTKDMIFQHYRALVRSSDAAEYWNITPDQL